MPKYTGKKTDNFEGPQGIINDFEFQQSHGAITEEERDRFARQQEERQLRESEMEASGQVEPESGEVMIPGATPPQTEAERIQQLMADVREKVARKKAKEAKHDAPATPTREAASAKKDTPRPPAAAKKLGASAKKTVGGASGALKSGAKKGAAAKSGAKKASSKTQARSGTASKRSVKASGAAAKKSSAAKSPAKKSAKKGGVAGARKASKK